MKAATIDGKQIEVHEDRSDRRRYWAKVDDRALFQRGRMQLRSFMTPETAWQAQLRAASQTDS